MKQLTLLNFVNNVDKQLNFDAQVRFYSIVYIGCYGHKINVSSLYHFKYHYWCEVMLLGRYNQHDS